MCADTKDFCDTYTFHFFDNVRRPPVELLSVGREARSSSTYTWDNSGRPRAVLFQYTLHGSGSVRLADGVHTVRRGQAFFLQLPADEGYGFDEAHNTAPWEFLYLILSGDAAEEYYTYITERGGKILDLPAYHPAIKLLTELYEAARAGRIGSAFLADSRAFAFLCALCDGGVVKNELVERAKVWMQARFAQPVTLFELAQSLGVSQSHLSREFVRCTEEKPIVYLTKLRLEEAVRLLLGSELGIGDISSACGFSSENYFGKVFKKYMGTSPAAFRKQAAAYGYTII